jgi:hypothetical protein
MFVREGMPSHGHVVVGVGGGGGGGGGAILSNILSCCATVKRPLTFAVCE